MNAPAHSKLDSPSAAERTEACPGSVALTMHLPDERSAYADEGTLAHYVAAWALSVLEPGVPVSRYMELHPGGSHQCPDVPADLKVTQEMCDYVQVYVDYVRREAVGAEAVYIEHRVAFNEALGVDGGAEGTCDALILFNDRAVVIDLKYGRGVQVFADSSQLKRYALGAREGHGMLYDIQEWKLCICQPRLDWIDEVVLTDAELTTYAGDARASAWEVRNAIGDRNTGFLSERDWESIYLNPGETQCRFCKAKATCPALAREVAETVTQTNGDIEAITEEHVAYVEDNAWSHSALGSMMSKVGMIEDWCKAVRAEVEKELIAGNPVPGFKLVQGRKGARAWDDEVEVEKMMRFTFRMKIEEAFNLSLISPAQAEKALKANPKRWKKLAERIVQKEGRPSVAPESDKRPAITVGAADTEMSDLNQEDIEA